MSNLKRYSFRFFPLQVKYNRETERSSEKWEDRWKGQNLSNLLSLPLQWSLAVVHGPTSPLTGRFSTKTRLSATLSAFLISSSENFLPFAKGFKEITKLWFLFALINNAYRLWLIHRDSRECLKQGSVIYDLLQLKVSEEMKMLHWFYDLFWKRKLNLLLLHFLFGSVLKKLFVFINACLVITWTCRN